MHVVCEATYRSYEYNQRNYKSCRFILESYGDTIETNNTKMFQFQGRIQTVRPASYITIVFHKLLTYDRQNILQIMVIRY